MYRTYVKLFRVQPEITTLGTGTKVIRLPKEYWITADVGIITFVILPIARFLVMPILTRLLGIHSLGPALESPINWVLAFVTSFLVAVYLRRFDPDGKSIVRWSWDYLKYLIQPKWSDGWTDLRGFKNEEYEYIVKTEVYSIHRNLCCSLPAEGVGVTRFALYKSADISVNRRGKIKFSVGNKFVPGIYSVKGRQIVKIGELTRKEENHDSNKSN